MPCNAWLRRITLFCAKRCTISKRRLCGTAIQAGLYPNPVFGFEADTISEANTAGQQGGFIQQTIKTAGKLKLAQAAASIDVRAQRRIILRRAQLEVASQVRSNYFAVLVAQETFRSTYALASFTDEAYGIWTDQVFAQQAAPYEPLQLRRALIQARGNLIQAPIATTQPGSS